MAQRPQFWKTAEARQLLSPAADLSGVLKTGSGGSFRCHWRQKSLTSEWHLKASIREERISSVACFQLSGKRLVAMNCEERTSPQRFRWQPLWTEWQSSSLKKQR